MPLASTPFNLALLAQGRHTQGINPLGIATGVENINRSRLENSLLKQNIDEFDLNTGVRNAQRGPEVDTAERASLVEGDRLELTHF